MAGLVPAIHAAVRFNDGKKDVCHRLLLQQRGSVTAWMPATSAGMTPLVSFNLSPPSFETQRKALLLRMRAPLGLLAPAKSFFAES
jgi:hypothetical protein